MGCNTSQELKTKDGAAAAAASNNDEANNETTSANGKVTAADDIAEQQPQSAAMAAAAAAADGDAANHIKSNTILSNGEAKKSTASSKLDAAKGKATAATAAISELDDMELGEDEAKAATKIQAVFRGHQVRATIKKGDTETTTITTTTSSAAGNGISSVTTTKEVITNRNGPTDVQTTGVSELEAEFDPDDKELCDAALKIQAAFRGHMTRKTINKDTASNGDEAEAHDDIMDIKELTKKVAEELDIDLNDPELNKAATKIQASFRGHKIRKEVTTTAAPTVQ